MKTGCKLNKEDRNILFARLKAFQERPGVQRGLKVLRALMLVGVVAYLIYRFSEVGWREVLGALPSSPLFYIFFILRFLVLPLSELIIYQKIWNVPLAVHFPAFVRKRVFNFAVMGYSGEGFLTLWARRTLSVPTRKILSGVKDNNLLSALTSNIATVVVIIFLFSIGELNRGISALPPGGGVLFMIAFLTALTLSVSVIFFRKKIIALPGRMVTELLGIHFARIILILGLHAAMYSTAIPGPPVTAWFMFLALQLVLSRIPFIPNQDLFFLGAALSLSAYVGASEAALAGMLVAEAGLSQIVNFTLFFATVHLARVRGEGPEDETKKP